jgi:hypothetical protein
MKSRINCFAVIVFSILWSTAGISQELSKYLGSYNNVNAAGYLQPLVDLSSGAMNTGVWSSTPLDSGFHVRVGLSVGAALPYDAQRTFTARTEAPFTPEQTAEAPTIIGDVEHVTVSGINGTAYVFPGGFNAKYFPVAVPEISLGSFYGTDLQARFLAFEMGNEYGAFSQWGVGVQHKLTQYFDFWSDLYFGYQFQSLGIGDEIDGRFQQIGVRAERSNRIGRYYLLLAYQPSTMDFYYEHGTGEDIETVDVSIDGEYPVHAEVGGELNLSFLRLRAGVKVTPPFSASVGLNFYFGDKHDFPLPLEEDELLSNPTE